MPSRAVGLYCAVDYRFDHLVSTRTIAVRETQTVFDQWAESLLTRLGVLNLGSVAGRRYAGGSKQPATDQLTDTRSRQ